MILYPITNCRQAIDHKKNLKILIKAVSASRYPSRKENYFSQSIK